MTQSSNRWAAFIQKNGPGTILEAIMSNTDYSISAQSPVTTQKLEIKPGTSPDGTMYPKYRIQSPPDSLAAISFETYNPSTIDYLEQAASRGIDVVAQTRYLPCGILSNPHNAWTETIHMRGTITKLEIGESRKREPSGELVTRTAELTPTYAIHLFTPEILPMTTGLTTEHVNCVDSLEMPASYRQIEVCIFAGTDSGEVIYSINGGNSFSKLAAKPFPGTPAEAISEIAVESLTEKSFRVIVGSATSNKVAYADADFGAESSMTWTQVTVGSSGSIGGLLWTNFGHIYVAVGSKIYESSDQGASFPTLVHSGSNAINQLVQAPNEKVWACGATGALLVQEKPLGVFYSKVSPTSSANTAMDVANDNTILVANGTKLYRSRTEAENLGGWSETSFGNGEDIVYASFIGSKNSTGGDAELIMAALADGSVYLSDCGGAFYRAITKNGTPTYTAGRLVNEHLTLLTGEDGVLHKVSPKD